MTDRLAGIPARSFFTPTTAVSIPTSKIWNQDIGASLYRTGFSREDHTRLIRRSAHAASIGVWYRACPPLEAASFSRKLPGRALLSSFASAEIAARVIRVQITPFLHQCL